RFKVEQPIPSGSVLGTVVKEAVVAGAQQAVQGNSERDIRSIDEPRRELYPEGTGVFVGNLDPRVSEEELRAVFQRFGTIRRVILNWDKRPGIPTRYAVLFLESAEQANAALDALYGFKLNEREMQVMRFRARSPRRVSHRDRR